MTLKNIIGTLVFFAVAAIISFSFVPASSDAFGQYTLPAVTASVSDTIEVGPQADVQIVASSSRSYLYVAREDNVSPVYCNADGDNAAVIGGATSFILATSTSNYYEMYLDKNPYDGAIRCTAAASTTVVVLEYKTR